MFRNIAAFWPLLHLKAFLSEFWHNTWINLLCWDQVHYSCLEVMATLRAIRVADLFLSWGCLPFKDLYTPKDSDAYQISALSMYRGWQTFFCHGNTSCGQRTALLTPSSRKLNHNKKCISQFWYLQLLKMVK